MRFSKPLHLADLDPQRAADDLTQAVYARARRDAPRLGFNLQYIPLTPNESKAPLVATVLAQSRIHKLVRACVEWAKVGKGKPEEMAAALRELRSDLEGVEPGVVSGLAPDLATIAGVVVVAAEARLAVAEGRTVEALEVATLASVDERSIRATVTAGTLSPVGPGRPMRFAADVVRQYLYARGVPGFAASVPTKTP